MAALSCLTTLLLPGLFRKEQGARPQAPAPNNTDANSNSSAAVESEREIKPTVFEQLTTIPLFF